MAEIEFVAGMIVKPPRDGAPDYVKASISIKTDEFVAWLKEQLKDKPEWINIDIKSGKTGKWYAAKNTWKPKEKESEKPSTANTDPDFDMPF
jgi:hypothetical protein